MGNLNINNLGKLLLRLLGKKSLQWLGLLLQYNETLSSIIINEFLWISNNVHFTLWIKHRFPWQKSIKVLLARFLKIGHSGTFTFHWLPQTDPSFLNEIRFLSFPTFSDLLSKDKTDNQKSWWRPIGYQFESV